MIVPINSGAVSEETPAVSIVIPAYNAARYMRQTLDSIQAQTFTDYEVIVVNDGSSDREQLETILREHPLKIIYLSQENRGVSAARNAAIKIARGTYYAQLDADDQWKPDYLAVQLGILASDPSISLVYPNALIISDSSDANLEFMKACPSEGEVTFESLIEQTCIVMTCVTARMEAIKNAGMFDELCRSCEDFDLWLRIAKQGRIIYHRQILALYRRHENSLSSDRVWMIRNLLAVFEKAKTMEMTFAERQALDKQIINSRAALRLFEGKQALKRGDTRAAITCFEDANEHLHTLKLSAVILLLRTVPWLVIWVYRRRERYLTSHPTHRLTGLDNPNGPAADSLTRTDNSACLS